MCFVLGFGWKRPDLKQYRISGLTPRSCEAAHEDSKVEAQRGERFITCEAADEESSSDLIFQVCFVLFAVVTSQTPTYSFVWERYTLRLNQNSSQDLHAYFLSCELFFFFSQLLLCLAVVLQFSRAFLLSQVELSIGCMFYLVREFPCCIEFCVLIRKQVVKVVVLSEVVTCNSFQVLTRVMFGLFVSRALAYQ